LHPAQPPRKPRNRGARTAVSYTAGHARSPCGRNEIAAPACTNRRTRVLTLDRLLNCLRRDRTLWAPNNPLSCSRSRALVGTGRPIWVPSRSVSSARNVPKCSNPNLSDGLGRPYVTPTIGSSCIGETPPVWTSSCVHSAERRGEVFNQWTNAWTDPPSHSFYCGEESDGGPAGGRQLRRARRRVSRPASGAPQEGTSSALVSVGRSLHTTIGPCEREWGHPARACPSGKSPRIVFPRAAQRPAGASCHEHADGSQAQSP
jgi:hypothetical protein